MSGSSANTDFVVALANQQSIHAIDGDQLMAAARSVLSESEFKSAAISLAVVDDATIHELNRRYLDHDWPTDVLGFVLDDHNGHLEGEVILSADTAVEAAREAGWSTAAEHVLYVIHGMLHLVGYDDKSPAAAERMRAAESRHLRRFGIERPAVVTSGGERGRQGAP
jgi:probable rRNA maturation factor